MNCSLFQVGLQKVAAEHTRLIYVTTGVLLWKLVQTKCLTEYTHIFVDEVHKHAEVWCMFLESIFYMFLMNYRIRYCVCVCVILFVTLILCV